MHKITTYLKALFFMLLPILRRAAIEVTADTVSRLAYPERSVRLRRRHTPYTRYDRMPRTATEQNVFERERIKRVKAENEGFHDVLMVAFDLSGPNAHDVHHWLHGQMPGGDMTYGDIHLDSWWVANDERFDRSDCDSAVFVRVGNQEEARALLRAERLA